MRPTLFRLASDTEDSDEALGEFADLMTVIACHIIKVFMQSLFSYKDVRESGLFQSFTFGNHFANEPFSAFSGYFTG